MRKLAFVVILFSNSYLCAADIYKWQDQNGQWQFSSSPPPTDIKKIQTITIQPTKNESSDRVHKDYENSKTQRDYEDSKIQRAKDLERFKKLCSQGNSLACQWIQVNKNYEKTISEINQAEKDHEDFVSGLNKSRRDLREIK